MTSPDPDFMRDTQNTIMDQDITTPILQGEFNGPTNVLPMAPPSDISAITKPNTGSP